MVDGVASVGAFAVAALAGQAAAFATLGALLLGTIVTEDPDRARVAGFFLHLVIGQGFALGYAATFAVLPRATWVPLSGFPLEAHQARASYVVSQGLLRRVLPFLHRPRYINSVLFLPDGRRPGVSAVGEDGGHALRKAPGQSVHRP